MQYFHRSSITPDAVLEEADRYFGGRLTAAASERRRREYQGGIGRITLTVQPEGGHYTLITLKTDNVGESEVDKVAKRFLSVVHTRIHPDHEVRGAY